MTESDWLNATEPQAMLESPRDGGTRFQRRASSRRPL
jgi:hypothetical protein